MSQNIENIRNVAIIAHVDHGKTTLVDQLLRQSGIFRSNQEIQERVMDSGDIERERGITILSKNTAVNYGDTKINIIDTPGHADFGGEVERVLKMVDGVVLVVDAFEGPMPQTKFVLRKALELNHPVVVCVNKVDRPEARPDEVVDEVLELFMELDANEDQLDSPFVFASARGGYASEDPSAREGDMKPLFEAIINHIPAPKGDVNAPAQALISTIDYSEYLGRIGIGKIENGVLRVNDEVVVLNMHNAETQKKVRITKLYEFQGLQRVEVKEASVGNIVALSGIENIMIGDTICVVVAETEEILEKAKKLVKVDYEKLEPIRNVHEAMAEDAPQIHSSGNLCQQRHVTRGDAKTALEKAAYKVTRSFTTPFTEHAFLEPECAVSFPYKDGIKILSTDQGAFDTRKEVSIMFGWDPEKIVVENQLIGGGFGGKEDVTVQHLTALAAYKYQRPVKAKFTRQESLFFHPKRHAMEGTFTLGCDENGIFTGLDCEIYFDTGAYASLCGPVLERACTHSVGPYCYQNTDIRGFGYYTNNPPAGAFRGQAAGGEGMLLCLQRSGGRRGSAGADGEQQLRLSF